MNNESGLSEVIAAVLLIALVTASMGIVAVVLTSNIIPTEVPHMDFDACNDSNKIYVYHAGGDTIEPVAEKVTFKVLDNEKRLLYEQALVKNWSTGEVINISGNVNAKYIQLIARTGEGDTLIEWTDIRPCKGIGRIPITTSPTPTASISPTPTETTSPTPTETTSPTPTETTSPTPTSTQDPECWVSPHISVSPSKSGDAPFTVTFTDVSDHYGGYINSWSWNFGEGSTYSTEGPHTITYSNPGTYTVTLDVGNECGASSGTFEEITVNAYCPSVTASFTSNVNTGYAPLSVKFTDTSSGSEPVTSWAWDFGDGTVNTTVKNPIHTYNSAGTYPVILTAFNSCGSYATATGTITVTDCPPVTASFTTNVSSGYAPLSILFTDTSSGTEPVTSWEWNFGDGTVNSTVKNPVHTFSSPGTYPVILTAFNSCGNHASTTGTISVTNCPPVTASFTTNVSSGYAPLSVLFTDTSSGSEPVTSWEWNFGDGTVNSTVKNPIHTYSSVGTYPVTLTAINSCGNHVSVTATITVTDCPPVTASFTTNVSSGFAPLSVKFTDSSSSSDPITTWNWSFGDGSLNSTLQHPVHTYTTGSTYPVILTVSNSCGNRESATSTITVTTCPPVTAAFTSNVSSGFAPLSVKFTDSSSSSDPITAWNWSFGDGSPNSTLQHPVYTYSSAGTYPVILTAYNSCGNRSSSTGTITITNCPPVTASFTSNVSSGFAPLSVRFTDTSSSSDPITAWNWSFGDGSPNSTLQHPVHTYTTGGMYPVILTAYNSCGSRSSSTGTITVTTCPPVTPSFTYVKQTNPRGRIFFDDFEASFSGWSQSGTVNGRYTGTPKYGNYDVQLSDNGSGDGRIWRTISTAGYSNIIVSFALGAVLNNNNEDVRSEWSADNGGSWTDLALINRNGADNQLHDYSITLPETAANNAQFSIRFRIRKSESDDYGYVDNVEVTGIPTSINYQFTDTSTSSVPITARNWSFGDSTANSTLQNPSHTYSTAGSYRVILTVINECGNNASISKRISTGSNYYYGQWDRTVMEPAGVYPANRIRFADSAASGYGSDMTNWPVPIIGRAENFSVQYDADLTITEGAIYTFYLTSDDGSWFWLNGNQIIDNGGLHAPQMRQTSLYLAPDTYPIQVKMFENTGQGVLHLEYSSPTMARDFVNAEFV